MSPSVGMSRAIIIRARVLFPEPDSPTIPKVSPFWTSSVISSTAVIVRLSSRNPERGSGKIRVTFFTEMTGSAAARRSLCSMVMVADRLSGGTEPTKACVYSLVGSEKTASVSPSSTSRPIFMTITC